MTITITPSAYSLSKDPILIAGNSAIDQSAHKARMRLHLYFGSDLVTPIAGLGVVLELTPDADGTFVFNLSGLIDEYLGNNFDAPTHQITTLGVCNNSLTYFGFDVEEYEDDVLIDSKVIQDDYNSSNYYIAFQAGTPVEFLGMTSYMTWRALRSYRPWQTWRTTQVVDTEMPVWAYYLYNSNSPLNMRCRVTLYVGGVAILNYGVYATLLFTRGLYQINCGYAQLGIQAALDGIGPGLVCDKYDVDITDISANPTASKLTFVLNHNHYINKNYLYWQNGIGGFDQIMLTGQEVTKADYERTTGALAWSIDNGTEGLVQTYGNRETYGKKVHTGILSPVQIDALRGLLNSPRIYHFDGSRYRPIQLTEKSKEIIKSGEFLHHTTIEWRYAYKNKTYWPANALS